MITAAAWYGLVGKANGRARTLVFPFLEMWKKSYALFCNVFSDMIFLISYPFKPYGALLVTSYYCTVHRKDSLGAHVILWVTPPFPTLSANTERVGKGGVTGVCIAYGTLKACIC